MKRAPKLRSVYGTERTFRDCSSESAFGGKADIDQPLLTNLDLWVRALTFHLAHPMEADHPRRSLKSETFPTCCKMSHSSSVRF